MCIAILCPFPCYFCLPDALNDMLQRSKQITVLRDLQAIRRYLMVSAQSKFEFVSGRMVCVFLSLTRLLLPHPMCACVLFVQGVCEYGKDNRITSLTTLIPAVHSSMESFFHMFKTLCAAHGIRTTLQQVPTKVRPINARGCCWLARFVFVFALFAHTLSCSLFVSRRVQAEDEDGSERVGVAPRVRKRRRADEDEEEEEEEEEEVQEEEEEEEAVEVEEEPVAPRRGQSSSKRARADSSSSQQSRRGASAAAPSRRTSHV